ncbi:MAG: phage holin family protein [Clostridiales bacterium]|jgi:uncharacterized membrane protein YvlD (DUF360 family)|nr:phage holin family protein [Clostridiales bacterium]
MLRNGLVTALTLLLIAFLVGRIEVLQGFDFLQVNMRAGIWPVIAVALAFGLINALLVPMVMKLFRRAKGIILFAVTVVVDAGALMLTAWIAPNSLYIGNWFTAFVVAGILALVGTLVLGREIIPKRGGSR